MSNDIVQSGQFLAPVADVKTALMRYQAVKEFINGVLHEGTDFGKIPGAGDKPALFKAGAEKMCSFFGLTPRIIESEQVQDWTGEAHNGEPFFYYRYRIGLYRGDYLIAEGEGSANSWEKKYRYRQAQRTCPNCGQAAIFQSKNKPEFYCWNKKGGCGATFKLDDKRITEQEAGQVKNQDVCDMVNTLQKMAQKRALMAPVLIATNTSDYFTQDIEDFITVDGSVVDDDKQPEKKPVPQTPAIDPQLLARWQALTEEANSLDIEHEQVDVTGLSKEALIRMGKNLKTIIDAKRSTMTPESLPGMESSTTHGLPA